MLVSPGGARAPDPWTLARLALFVAAAAVWLYPAGSSLWLDETVTVWVIRGGLPGLLHRSMDFQASPVFYLLPWLAAKLGGTGEVALRVPSLLCMAAAAWVLARLAVRLFGAESGVVAALLFVSLRNVAFEAADARPYAPALLCATGSMLCLVRWLRVPRRRDAAGAVLLAGLTVYLHTLFALMLLVQAAWIGFAVAAGDRAAGRRAWWLLAGVVLVLVPYLPQLRSLAERRDMLSWATARSLGSVLAPLLRLAGVLALGLLALAVARRRNPLGRLEIARPVLWGLLVWAFLPPATLYVVSLLTPYKLYVGRYFLYALPGFVLLLTGVLRSLRSARLGRAVGLGLAALLVVTSFRPTHGRDDWRSAVAAARRWVVGAPAPVLVKSGLIESDQAEWLRDPEHASYLLAPLAAYPMAGAAIPLPTHANAGTTAYLDDLARGPLARAPRAILIENGWTPSPFLERRLREAGFRTREVGRFGAVALRVCER